MSYHEGESGVWAIYSDGNDGAPVVSRIAETAVELLPGAESYEYVFFWPTGASLTDAIAWFRKQGELPKNTEAEAEVQRAMTRAVGQILNKSSESMHDPQLHARLTDRLMGLFHIRERYE